MSEEAKTGLKLPSKYKRPSYEEFKARGYASYTEEGYVAFFNKHEAELAQMYADGTITDESFQSDTDGDDMTDADGDGLPDVLHVKSQVRAQATRAVRTRNPGRHRFKQYLFGDPSKRLVRKRVLRLAAKDVRANLDELIDKEAAGILSVHAPNGARINLAALKAGRVEMAAVAPAQPMPNPPLDSAANDIPAGESMQQYMGGTFAGDPIAADVVARMASEKREAAEKREGTSEDPLDPIGAPMAPEGTPPTTPSTELEQPPVGIDGERTEIQDQLPQDSEASVEAPVVDPLAATEVISRGDAQHGQALQDITGQDGDALALSEAADPAKEETHKSSGKHGKKGHKR